MKTQRWMIAGACVLSSAWFIGVAATRTRATGVPAQQPLVYAGTLTDTDGKLLTGKKNFQLQLWDAASGGAVRCATDSTPLELAAGRFQITLPDTCTAAVRDSADLWCEILVDGASFGRLKLGAVAYALEAASAVEAKGALNDRIGVLETGALKVEPIHVGYVPCQPVNALAKPGARNVLVAAETLYSDASCATSVAGVSCHPFCAANSLLNPNPDDARCCGVATYYTTGLVRFLAYTP
jgi:hypothetical protein